MNYFRFSFFLVFADLLILGAPYKISDDFLECFSHQVGGSNVLSNLAYTPQNPAYASLLDTQNLRILWATRERPGLIVTPFHESHIVAAIHCSRKVGLQIRVRSGGHDYEGLSYASENNPFVTVDMRNLRSISIDVEEKTARVQAGATLGQFYHAIAQKSKTLAFPAGACPTVGVGGHFAGGGYGMISRKHALASDRIIDAKLINVDGQILDRSTMGEDLFWAIRGGGGTSFGIILEYKVSLVTIPETVTYFNVTRTSEAGMKLMHRWQYIADKVDENLLMRLFVTAPITSSGNRTVAASFVTLYLGPVTDLLLLMKEEFPELGLVKEDCKEMRWIDSVLIFGDLPERPVDILLDRNPEIYFNSKGKSDFFSSPIPMNGLREMWSFMIEVEDAHLQFSPYGGVLDTILESETPFPHRKGNKFMIHYSAGWFTANDEEKNMDWTRRLESFLTPYVTKSPRAAYFNYRDFDLGRNNNDGATSYEEASVWGFKYFKNNFRRLVRVKTKVDPSNFFRNEQSIPPLPSHRFSYDKYCDVLFYPSSIRI